MAGKAARPAPSRPLAVGTCPCVRPVRSSTVPAHTRPFRHPLPPASADGRYPLLERALCGVLSPRSPCPEGRDERLATSPGASAAHVRRRSRPKRARVPKSVSGHREEFSGKSLANDTRKRLLDGHRSRSIPAGYAPGTCQFGNETGGQGLPAAPGPDRRATRTRRDGALGVLPSAASLRRPRFSPASACALPGTAPTGTDRRPPPTACRLRSRSADVETAERRG